MKAIAAIIAHIAMMQATQQQTLQKRMEASGIKPAKAKNSAVPRFGNNRAHQSRAKRAIRKAIATKSQRANRTSK